MKYQLWLQIFCLTLFPTFTISQSRPSSLRNGVRYPDEDETEICGRIRDVIPRDSGRFRKILIRNTNNQADYANDDCRHMTSRAKSKMDILASRVLANWGGRVKLRVLRAWTDQTDPTDPASLHYEGRSLRLQLSDGDTNKLGRLAGLALEAGFDWVHYANQYYIRASVIPDVCQTSVDLVFLLDGSGSVGRPNFEKVKEFVKKVIDFFNIGVTGTHVGVVTYESLPRLEFKLNKYYTKSELRKAVSDIFYRGFLTYTGEALDYVRKEIFTKRAGMREDPGIPKVLVLLTDGYSNGKKVLQPATQLRDLGVSIFSIGVGSRVSKTELREIASDPFEDYVFILTTFNELSKWVDRLSSVSCSEGSLIKSCENAETSVTSGSFKYFRTEFNVVTDNSVSVEVRDLKGISHLYVSATSKNPGPLNPHSIGNEEDTSPRVLSIKLDGRKTVFVAVQGQSAENRFSLSFWNNLFTRSTFIKTINENLSPKQEIQLQLSSSKYNLEYSITDGNKDGFFEIEKTSPKIFTTEALDRETQSKYDLVVVAQDTNNKCHKSRTLVVVHVGDVNDNAPTFTANHYTADIRENAQSGTLVKTVNATDADVGVNGQISYSITSGNTGGLFSIDNDGRVVSQGALDHETQQSYTLTIKAQDGGIPSMSGTTLLQINVLDLNERPSITCQGSCILKVSENRASGTKVGEVRGSDPDTRSNCNLQFDIPSSAKATFEVRSNGDIRTRKVLDRELTPHYVFVVRVQDCSSPRLSDSVKVTVTVGDVNDNPPQFNGPYIVDLSENEVAGSTVVQVKADDPDEGVNGDVIYALHGLHLALFEIDPASGRITTKQTLDYEAKTSYKITVAATDQATNPLMGITAVTVHIIDVNDMTPAFTGLPYIAQVNEDATSGTHVKTVQADDDDSGLGGAVRYSIILGNTGNAFEMDLISGEITVKSNLDREIRDSYTLVIEASDRGSPSLASETTVTITIQDVNDNSPIFHGNPYTALVSENTPINQFVLKVSATDEDIGNFGRITFSIQSHDNAQQIFKIYSNGSIDLNSTLDYETKKTYSFTVLATDGGTTTSANVHVVVEDYNDNKPTFDTNPYTETIAENANVGDFVGMVRATDEDSGPRGGVTYSITSGNVGNAFRISSTGSVTVASFLDRETLESYTLTIKASDDGIPSLSSTTKMIVTVTDINDNKPTFKQPSYSFKISENNTVNQEVGKIGPATDEDKGNNAKITYSIVSGDRSGTFSLGTNGELIARIRLDRETTPSYNLIVQAKDKGTSPLYTQVPVAVIVEDENDNTPVFSPTTYNCKIAENSAENTPVCFVRATDKDAGKNGIVTYELVTPSSDFSVDQNNGEIKAIVTFDREQKESYSFEVLAKDGGSPAENSKVTVNVKVVDKNDNEPLFTRKTYRFDVSEDAQVTTNIGQVVADDKDEGLNGEVVYSITGGNTNTAFEINQATGNITVKSSLDRETVPSYTLNVRANDRGTPSLFSSRVVSIIVKDVNDNDPIFTSSRYSGGIAEDASVGSFVVQVKASDDDEGNNGKITYTITEGLNKDHFSIEGDTGLIRTASALDYETISSYLIGVTASDGGTPSRSSKSHVNITITNTNDNIPTFVSGSPMVNVSESVAIGTDVIKFNATDGDGNDLEFSITSGNTDNALIIDNKTGLLTTNKNLDRENTPGYNLTVTVKDTGGQSSSRNLSVVVLDVNDNAPKFQPSSYQVNVTENTAAGSVVTVTATDIDEGENAKISFSIDPISAKTFTIDSTTGVISTKNPLDREKGARYIIKVTAKDAGKPSLSSLATVEVTVIDTNDNSPTFNNDYSTNLRENTAKGKTVLRVEATDPDSGVNGEIQYTITNGNGAGFFSLNPKDGSLVVEKSPDRETDASFTLTVTASNKMPLAASAVTTKTTCIVTITIEDVNDNAPNITNNVLVFYIPENSKSSTPVFDVDAIDKDNGVNSEVEYEIVSGNIANVYVIDSTTGQVTVNGSLDSETLNIYTLKIRASDNGTPSLFSEKDFTVHIADEDDNPPVFAGLPYQVLISEKANISTRVIVVKATDKDVGLNGKVAYSISSGNELGHFRINTSSGEVLTNAALDYEKIQNYDFVVIAQDTKHTVRENVRIWVVNVNDNNPVFNPDHYNVSIPENAKLDMKFLTVNATDEDPFGGLSFTIVSGDKKFSLDSSNGQLRVASKLDRETTDFFNLTVQVTDGGKPALSDRGFVEVHITDINDNAPEFPSLSIRTTVVENTAVGVMVLQVNATDSDLGENAKLQYVVTKGNDQNLFKLDPDTGHLRVNGNIDREKTLSFHLDIVAKDKGSPSLTSDTLRVDITVLDENDNDPEFKKNSYQQNITENLFAGTFVEQVDATDEDIELNGRVVYSIKSGAKGHFIIGNETGIVKTVVPLDRENISSYTIVIEARDLGTPRPRQSTVVLDVNVVDANDNAPAFRFLPIRGNITEEQPKGQYVTRVNALDSDEGGNAEIEYKLATQNGRQMLSIDSKTGEIRTRVVFDYEEQKVYTVKVTASDKGNPSLSTTVDFTINILDIDDNCPEFNPKEYNVTIQENLPFNHTILRVTATDKDSAGNQDLNYGIRSGNDAGSITIDSVTGEISPSGDVDREFSTVYSLIVRAGSDFCGVNASDTDLDETSVLQLSDSIAKVNIFVTDVNDNPPEFLQSSYSHVFSDIYQTSLLWVNATDPDEGVNGEVIFEEAGLERVNSKRMVTVRATDKGKPSHSSTAILNVTMAEGVNCEAMNFHVSHSGHVTVKTLCDFEPFKIVGVALVGNSAKLECSAKGNTVPEYRWTKNTVPVTDWSKDGAYKIKSLTKDDAGQYYCIASSEAGTILSKPIQLIVKESPTITVQPKNTWAEMGGSAVLHCLATGDRPIEYSWYKKNEIFHSIGNLRTDKADLVFSEVISGDAEDYYCKAKNSIRTATSHVARFEVYTKYNIVEMEVSVNNPRYEESCQYFDIQDLKNTLGNAVEGEVVITEYVKPETICNVTHCSSDPCKNQGKCLIVESRFVCQCPRGWSGVHCEKDVNECLTESCSKATCQNRRGSYSCDCKKGTSGKRCQLSNAVCQQQKTCLSNQTCYPKETLEGYECISNATIVTMVFKLDESRRPWKDWMKYDIAREIENAIASKQSQGNRKRRNAVSDQRDYSICSVVSQNASAIGDREVELEAVLVCSKAPSRNYVCDALFNEGKVSSCTGDDGIVTTQTPTAEPATMNPVSITLAFIVSNRGSGEELEAAEAIGELHGTEVDDDTLKKYGVTILVYKARHPRGVSNEASVGMPAGVMAGVIVAVIVVLIIGIAIAFVVIRTKGGNGKDFSIKSRSVMARNVNSSKTRLTRDISMKELNESESRAVNSRTFSEISEEPENVPEEDLEDGSFIVANVGLSPKKQDRDYMYELDCSPWFHGSLSRRAAEDLLEDEDNEGSFLVRAGRDEGEFYVSVKAPAEGGPKFRHIAVNRHQNNFVAVCGPEADAIDFTTFHELIDYLRANPTHFDSVGPDILLTDHMAKK